MRVHPLTDEETRQLAQYRANWLSICLQPGPADVGTIRRVTGEMYRAIGKEPVPVLRLSSPAMVSLFLALMNNDQLKGQLGDRLGGQLWGQLGGQLWGQLGGQLWGQLWGQLRDQLGGQLRDQLGGQLRDQLWGQLGYHFGGLCDGGWVAFYDFPERHLQCKYDVQISQRLAWWRDMAAASFWWWPFDNLVVVSDRPVSRWDDNRRLHSAESPAVLFQDGYALYAWHGVRVPERVIMTPESLTTKEILEESNAEVQRVMIERFGQGRFLQTAGAAPIHDDECGTLYRIDLVGDEPLVMVKVINSTPEPDGTRKPYYLRVHPELRPMLAGENRLGEPQKLTARNAVASTFGMRGEEYHPEVET